MALDDAYKCLSGGVRFSNRLYDGVNLYFKIVPIQETGDNSYYIALIPPVKDGTANISASLYTDDSLTFIPDPPVNFTVSGLIDDGELKELYISDLEWSPKGFKTSGGGTIYGNVVLLDIISENYPKSLWRVKIPRENGVFTSVASSK